MNVYNVEVIVLGEFEYLVLATAARLGPDAYGGSIRIELTSVLGRPCSIGALYTTLDRLERKGLINTEMGEPTPERGGRARRLVQVTRTGAAEAKAFYNTVLAVSQGVKWAT